MRRISLYADGVEASRPHRPQLISLCPAIPKALSTLRVASVSLLNLNK